MVVVIRLLRVLGLANKIYAILTINFVYFRCDDEKRGDKDLLTYYSKSYEDQLEYATKYEATNERRARQRRSTLAFMSNIWANEIWVKSFNLFEVQNLYKNSPNFGQNT